jgi:hypothetical protein
MSACVKVVVLGGATASQARTRVNGEEIRQQDLLKLQITPAECVLI